MAAKANTSNNSIIISSSDDEDQVSDSDSTDYEPEPKKCKLEESKDGGTVGSFGDYLGSDTLVTIPIRATTSVEFETQGVQDALGANGMTRREGGGINTAGSNNSNGGGDEGSRRAFISVASLVEQTLDAALGPHASNTQSPFSQFSQDIQALRDQISVSQGIHHASSSHPPVSYGGDFPTIAREVVIRTVGRTSTATTQEQQSQTRRRHRRRPRLRRNVGNSGTVAEESGSGSSHASDNSASHSSSEYFTDDVDPQDIPSDEYLSPPLPARQRRNAIFVRRDPPPSVQNDDDQYYHNELEVASVLDMNENPIEDGSSTSNVDDEVLRRSLSPFVVQDTSQSPRVETDNHFADNENARSEADSEQTQPSTSNSNEPNASDSETPSDKDKTLCTQCHSQKAEPYFRHCLRCFKIRRQWLPPRPASRRLKSRKALMRSSNPNSLNNSRATRSSDTSEGEDTVDGGPYASQNRSSSTAANTTTSSQQTEQTQGSLPSSQQVDLNEGFVIDESDPASTNRITLDSQPEFTPSENLARSIPHLQGTTVATDVESQSQSQSGSSSSQSQRSLVSINSQNSGGTIESFTPPSQPQRSSSPITDRPASSDLFASLSSQCSICFVREKDAAFVHNKIAHLYCCYTCADKILKKNGKCPICRERVLRVVKIINV